MSVSGGGVQVSIEICWQFVCALVSGKALKSMQDSRTKTANKRRAVNSHQAKG